MHLFLKNIKLKKDLILQYRFYWEFIMVVTIICLLISVPYQAAFRMNERSLYWTVFKNVLLFLCCVDIIFNFMSG